MKAGSPSRTAQAVAVRCAAHQLLDFPHVLEDPIALRIIGLRAAASIMLRLPASQLPVARYLRAFVTARSRYAEDQLARAVAAGTAQYVILGAGLDTFAYRNPYPAGSLRVFEVDHPDTQAWKRRRLAETSIPVPPDLTFVPVDFEHQKLDVELERAGLRLGERAFFSWLGVTPYLTNDVVLATLALIHSFCPDNAIAFDYALPRQGLSAPEKLAHDAIRVTVGQAGEPFRSFFSPDALVSALTTIGFRRVESLTTDEINARYFRNRLDGLQVRGRLGGLMCAE
ncbi:MAG TPA: SAM-dependent methyltransferase [Acidisphaera sp.]|nr:SAM-dependent methyltransferase [Acidisphaera sp.]